jgi:hypothetical protein
MSRAIPMPEEPTGRTWVLPAGTPPSSLTTLERGVLAGLVVHLQQHPDGVSFAECEVVVRNARVAPELIGGHRAMALMRWASANRGIEFRCIDGIVTCDIPANLEIP